MLNLVCIQLQAPVIDGPSKRQTSQNSVEATDSSASIDGLTPGVSYLVSVRANTAAGSGVVSEPADSGENKKPLIAKMTSIRSLLYMYFDLLWYIKELLHV